MNITTPTQKVLTLNSATELPSSDDETDDRICMTINTSSPTRKVLEEVARVQAEMSAANMIGSML